MKFLQFIQKYGYNLNPNKAIHVIAPSHTRCHPVLGSPCLCISEEISDAFQINKNKLNLKRNFTRFWRTDRLNQIIAIFCSVLADGPLVTLMRIQLGVLLQLTMYILSQICEYDKHLIEL